MNRDEILDLTRTERRALDELVAGLDADDLQTDGVMAGFSIKDVLAHIAVWERRMSNAIEAWRHGEKLEWPEPGYTIAQVDELNDRDFAAGRARSLDDVLRESRDSYARAISVVESVTDAEIDGWREQFGRPQLTDIIRANMDEHYREHLDQIDVWIQGQRA
jgi:uncharacterized protein (TIGR03083 family)